MATLNQQIIECGRCLRLRQYCGEVAKTKRRAYLLWDYWGRPVPSFGDPEARLLILGLAPGAHGANRTGRMFTGDRSGDFLYRSLQRAGFASQPESVDRNDGLKLHGAWITAAAHCAPPDNKPLPTELAACRPWLEQEVRLLKNLKVVVALGKIAFDTWLSVLKDRGSIARRGDIKFSHGADYHLSQTLICSYHPSQQNTSTGRLTQEMLDGIFLLARDLIRSEPVLVESRPSRKRTRF